MKFELYLDKEGKHRWRVTADNGEIVGASSQGFSWQYSARLNALILAGAIDHALGVRNDPNSGTTEPSS